MRRASDFLYSKLYKLLKEQIHTGMIKPGELLMSEQELCTHYKMSRNTVRRALDELQKENLVVKKPGLGTIVSPNLAALSDDNSVLRIAVPYSNYFVDYGMPHICNEFARKYPDTDIHIMRLPAATFWESVRQAEVLGTPPHILLVSDILFSSLDSFENFADLQQPLQETAEIYNRLCWPFRREGKLLAMPVTFSPVYLTYNSDMFASSGIELPQANWSTEQFIDAAKQLTTVSDGMISRFGFSLHPSFSRWLVLALQNGMKPGGQHNRQIIADTLTQLQSWLHRDRFTTTYSHVWNLGNPYIYEKAAMSLTTMFEMSSWLDRGIPFTPKIAPLPFGSTNSTLMNVDLFMVPRDNPELEKSIKFLEVALDDRTQSAFSTGLPFLSVKEKVNALVKPKELLKRVNIDGDQINNNYFVHELIDSQEQDDSRLELHLYWLGLEKAAQIANHF